MLKAMVLGGLAVLALCSGCGRGRAQSTAGSQEELRRQPRAGVLIAKYPGNYTCFKLVTAEGRVIVTEPYGMNEDLRADIVTTGHRDFDHCDFSRLSRPFMELYAPGKYSFHEIAIRGVAGHHNFHDTDRTNTIFVFDVDGLRLAQFASQGEYPSEEMFGEIGKVDVLIIQIYGREYNKLEVGEAVKIAARLGAKIVIPAHTDTRLNDRLAELLAAGRIERIPDGRLLASGEKLDAGPAVKVVVLDVAERR